MPRDHESHQVNLRNEYTDPVKDEFITGNISDGLEYDFFFRCQLVFINCLHKYA